MPAEERPLLAIVYGAGSTSMLMLSEPARSVCDLAWVVDSEELDDPTMLRLLRKLGTVVDVAGMSADDAAETLRPLEPRGIVAYADRHMPLASALAERLGLDYHDVVVTERLVDKLAQRHALQDAGLPVPRYVDVPLAPTAEEIRSIAARVEFPVVLKPRHGAASRDTVLVNDAVELERRIAQPTVEGLDPAMVIEEYMVGASPAPSEHFADYLSVESVVVAGEINHLAVTGRMHQVPPFREVGLIIPSDFDPALVKEVLDVATDALVAMGVRTGCFHTEIKATTAGLRVIEVNGRIGGFVAEVLALAAPDVDFVQISQRVAVGAPVALPDVVVDRDRVGYVIVEQPPVGACRVAAADGLDLVAAFPGVDAVFLSRQPGDAVDWRKGSHEYVYSVLGAAPDHDGVRAVQQFISENVTITYE